MTSPLTWQKGGPPFGDPPFCANEAGLAAAPDEAQQRDEEVDEVEVELERTGQREALIAHVGPAANLLRVVGGEAGEHEHRDDGRQDAEPRRVHEEIEDADEDEA